MKKRKRILEEITLGNNEKIGFVEEVPRETKIGSNIVFFNDRTYKILNHTWDVEETRLHQERLIEKTDYEAELILAVIGITKTNLEETNYHIRKILQN